MGTTTVSSANAFFRFVFVFVLDGTIHTPYLRSRDPFIIYVQQNLCFAGNGFFLLTQVFCCFHFYLPSLSIHKQQKFKGSIPCMHASSSFSFTFFTISIILTNKYHHFCRIISFNNKYPHSRSYILCHTIVTLKL